MLSLALPAGNLVALGTTVAVAAGLSVQVSAVTGSVASVAGSARPVTAACPAGTVLLGGGIRLLRQAATVTGNGAETDVTGTYGP